MKNSAYNFVLIKLKTGLMSVADKGTEKLMRAVKMIRASTKVIVSAIEFYGL